MYQVQKASYQVPGRNQLSMVQGDHKIFAAIFFLCTVYLSTRYQLFTKVIGTEEYI